MKIPDSPACDLAIHPELALASSLPSEYYVDPQWVAREKEQIFARSWQVVAPPEGDLRPQLQKPGDYFTTELAGEPLLLVRDSAGKLRGFYNVCRHRAGPPAEGCGSKKVFRCGYHGWTYSLEGALLAAPEFEGVKEFEASRFSLAPVRVEEWAGFVFVNLDPDAPPLLSALGELPQRSAIFGFERMAFHHRQTYVMECNWKTYIDNYLEGYHLPSVHPGLNRELDYGSYTTELFANYSLQSSPIRADESRGDSQRRYAATSGQINRADYFWIFPNWMLNCYPDNVSLNLILPLGAERSMAIFAWYFPPQLMKTGLPGETVRFSDEIQKEDVAICEIVQRNLRSRSYQRGRFSVKQEKGVHHFHRLYAAAISSAAR